MKCQDKFRGLLKLADYSIGEDLETLNRSNVVEVVIRDGKFIKVEED